MGWREKYRQASFRGVIFSVKSHSFEGGRRTVTHEFAFRDDPWTEDIGRKARRFPVEAYVFGENYFTRRDRLLAAFEKKGAGDLIHPYLGKKRVNVVDFSVTEEESEGGIAHFQVTFVEAGRATFPLPGVSEALKLIDDANALIDSANEAVQSTLDLASLPAFAVQSAAGVVEGFADVLAGVRDGLAVAFGPDAITSLASAIQELKDSAVELVQSPFEIADRIGKAFDYLSSVILNSRDRHDAMVKLAGFGRDAVLPAATTATRARERANMLALQGHVQAIAGAYGAKVMVQLLVPQSAAVAAATATVSTSAAAATAAATAATATTDSTDATARVQVSSEEAVALKDQLTAELDLQIEAAATEGLYRSLANVRAGLVKLVTSTEIALPNLVRYQPLVTTNALALAYRFFKDLTREQEIVDRNRLVHPGFIPGGQVIEVVGG
jgi:prophage DNA circulation protein